MRNDATFPEPSEEEPSVIERALLRIAGAYERMAAAQEEQLELSRRSVEIQEWMARDSQALRAEYEEGKQH